MWFYKGAKTGKRRRQGWSVFLPRHPEGIQCDLFITHGWAEGVSWLTNDPAQVRRIPDLRPSYVSLECKGACEKSSMTLYFLEAQVLKWGLRVHWQGNQLLANRSIRPHLLKGRVFTVALRQWAQNTTRRKDGIATAEQPLSMTSNPTRTSTSTPPEKPAKPLSVTTAAERGRRRRRTQTDWNKTVNVTGN